MGRQIEYYMELESYKLIVKKAYELGFVAIEGQNNFRICNSFDEVTFSKHTIYFYLEEVGQLIVKEDGYIDDLRSPLIESGFSYINEKEKKFPKAAFGFQLDFGTIITNSFREMKY